MAINTPITHYTLTANNGKTYRVPHRPDWHSGPPPFAGWWPADANENAEVIRWWDGALWSLPANPRLDEVQAASFAAMPTNRQVGCRWTHPWW